MGFLAGKRAFIVGIASNRSIAWGIARAMAREGAELAFSYQGEKLRDRVEAMGDELDARVCVPMDVSSDEEITAAFATLRDCWDELDIIVHSVGYAPRDQLNGRYLDCVNREGFRIAHDISSYSFAALAKAGRGMLRRDGALLTLTYLGAIRAIPNYNVMGPAKASLEANVRFMAADLGLDGIRVNAISAGPIKTLAAAGIGNIREMLRIGAEGAALKRNVSIDEVGNAAAFLCSDLASGITGEVIYVDAGFRALGMGFPQPETSAG
ncbi:MAG: enoyl-ACP reductase [Gammaproteobacteria bacterium]|nr:MAG: enoyl-ACP reductase [Gammaproteobacteria bacterium]